MELISVSRMGTGIYPADAESEEVIKSIPKGQPFIVEVRADRNARMHRAYFSILAFVWENLPEKLQSRCPKQHFYKLLKELQGRYEIVYKNGDHEVKEYESINFRKMSQKRFHEVFKADLDFICTDILEPLGMNDFISALVMQYELTLVKYNL